MEKLSERDLNLSTAKIIYQNANKVTVFLTTLGDKGYFVVKKLMISSLDEGNSILKETFAMVHLNHPSIARLHSSMMGGNNNAFEYILFVMDYYEDGDLQKEIEGRSQQNRPWTEDELIEIFKSLLSGFAYMQMKKIAHCDVKPQNVLRRGNKYTISDLGCAFKTDGDSFSIAGTPAYLSPVLRSAYQKNYMNNGVEVALKHNAYKSDVYSLGLVFLCMASLKLYTQLETLDNDQHYEILANIYHSLQYGRSVKDLIFWMMRFDEGSRPDFTEIAQVLQIEAQAKINQSLQRQRPSSCKAKAPPELRGIKKNTNSSIRAEAKKTNANFNAQNVSESQLKPMAPNSNYLVENTQKKIVDVISPVLGKMFVQPIGNNRPYNFRPIQNMANFRVVKGMNNNSAYISKVNSLLDNYTKTNKFALILKHASREMFKWRVSINLIYAQNHIIKQIELAFANLDSSCLNILGIKNSLHLKIIINRLNAKCKICFCHVYENYLKYPCKGFIHKACLQQNFFYKIENQNFYLNAACKVCNIYHVIDYRVFNLCSICQNTWTYYKGTIQGYYCLSCIFQFQQNNENISIFKIFARDSQEIISDSSNLCYYCNGLAELLMNNTYYICLTCRFQLARTTYMNEQNRAKAMMNYNSVAPQQVNYEKISNYALDDATPRRSMVSQYNRRNGSHAPSNNKISNQPIRNYHYIPKWT